MKRAQVAALVAGAALGLAGVAAAAVVLSRKENRETAMKLARSSAELSAKGTRAASEWAAQGSKVVGDLAEQARKLGEVVARQAVEQYHTQAPHALETLSGVLPMLHADRKEPATVDA